MGKSNSSPSIPPPPNLPQSYQQGINVYLQNLPRILQSEMANRSTYDPQRIAEQQALQNQFGTTQYNQMLSALGQMDPQWTGLHSQLGNQLSGNLANGTPLQGEANKLQGNLSSQYYNGNPDTKKLLGNLSSQYYNGTQYTKDADQLLGTLKNNYYGGSDSTKQAKSLLGNLQSQYAQGTKLSPDELAQQQQLIRRSQASRGNSYGQAPISAEAYSLGDRGLQLQQQRLGNLQSGLGQYNQFGQQDLSNYQGGIGSANALRQQGFSNYMGGLGLRDTEHQNAFGNYMGGFNLNNALNQQNYSNIGSFLSGPSVAQEAGMIPPVSPDRSMAYTNPNAGFQGEQFALQNYQNQLGASQLGQSGSNPWSTIGSIASVAGPILGAVAGFSKGGTVPGRVDYRNIGLRLPQSTDTQPAMLTPGEVVLNKPEQAKVGMKRIKAAVGHKHGKPIMGGMKGFSQGGFEGGGIDVPPANMAPDPLYPSNPNETAATLPSLSDPNVQVNQSDPYNSGQTPSMNPPGSGPNGLVPPPSTPYVGYMPPAWTKFLPPQAQAVIKMYQLGDRFKSMYQNWRQNKSYGSTPSQGSNPSANPSGNPDGYFSPDYLRRIGYEPGQGTGSLWPGSGPSSGPNDVGAYGVGGGGGSFFHDMGGQGGPLPGSLAGLGAGQGGSIESIGGKIAWHQAQPMYGGMTLAQVSKFMPFMLPGLSKMGPGYAGTGGGWKTTKTGPGGIGQLSQQ